MKHLLLLALLTALPLVEAGSRTAVVSCDPNAPGEKVTEYRVYSAAVQTTNRIFAFVGSAPTNSVTISGVSPLATLFTMTAVNAGGESDPAIPVLLDAAPSKPLHATVVVTISITNSVVVP